jgi:hypothetical protein
MVVLAHSWPKQKLLAVVTVAAAVKGTGTHICLRHSPHLMLVRRCCLQDALLPPLISSGLYQVLLEGVLLLLLGADPAVYPQTPEMQSQLWDDLTKTVQAGSYLTWEVAAQ